jgi:hypothetical protein
MYNLATYNQRKCFTAAELQQAFLQYALPVMGASSETRMVVHTHTHTHTHTTSGVSRARIYK